MLSTREIIKMGPDIVMVLQENSNRPTDRPTHNMLTPIYPHQNSVWWGIISDHQRYIPAKLLAKKFQGRC